MTYTKKPKKYLTNKNLMAEVIACKETGIMSDKLAKMFMMLVEKYGRKSNFYGYTYNEDMQAYALMELVKRWQGFDPERSNNPFAFYTQAIKNSFYQMLNKEKRQRDIRDELLIDKGYEPSFKYSNDHAADCDAD